jgi:hypothetical protein
MSYVNVSQGVWSRPWGRLMGLSPLADVPTLLLRLGGVFCNYITLYFKKVVCNGIDHMEDVQCPIKMTLFD